MKVIVGLGNPTSRYANTRHNIGAMTVDRLCKQWGIRLERRNRYALVGQGRTELRPVDRARCHQQVSEPGSLCHCSSPPSGPIGRPPGSA